MINHNNEAVLIDFGVSALKECSKEDPSKQTVGTFQFFAPEMFEKFQIFLKLHLLNSINIEEECSEKKSVTDDRSLASLWKNHSS